jgi:uncharacterized protein (TIGR02099 family)
VTRIANRLPGFLIRLAWLATAAALVLAAIWVVVAGQLLSALPGQRAALVDWVGQRTGLEVDVRQLGGHMRLLTPVVQLRDVSLRIPGSSEPAVTVARIDVEPDVFATLIARRPVLALLQLDGAALTLEQDDSGRWRVRGMPAPLNTEASRERLRQSLLLLYRQRDVVVTRSQVAIAGEGLPVSTFERVDLRMHNDGDAHLVSGSTVAVGAARLPLRFALGFTGAPVLPADLVADLHLGLDPAPLEDWLPTRNLGGVFLDALTAGGDAWLRIENARLAAVSGALQVDSVSASLEDGRKIEGILGASTRFRWEPRSGGWQVALGGLAFRRHGAVWPDSDAALAVTRNDAGQLQLRAALSRGSIEVLAGFAGVLPEAARQGLVEQLPQLAPRGEVRNLYLDLDQARPAESRWRLQLELENLAVNAAGAVPGISGVSAHVEATPVAGYAALATRRSALDFPTVFDALLAVNDGNMRLAWHRDGPAWRLRTDLFRLASPNARASGLASLEFAPGEPAQLHLIGRIEDGNGKVAGRYLPRKVMREALLAWLDMALVDGLLEEGAFLYEGPVGRDPAIRAQRTYEMRFRARDMTLRYLADYPPLTAARADVHIVDGKVTGTGTGTLLGARLADIRTLITPRDDQPALLEVSTRLEGNVADGLGMLTGTPLAAHMPPELARWRGDGLLRADVSLAMPLAAGSAPQVDVEGAIEGARFESAGLNLAVSDVSGAIAWRTGQGFSASGLRGRALGSEFTGSAATRTLRAGQQTRVDLAGALDMAAVRDWLRLPSLRFLAGRSPAGVSLLFGAGVNSGAQLELRSDLNGITATAPSPVGKAAAQRRPTQLTLDLGGSTRRLAVTSGELRALLDLAGGDLQAGAVALGAAGLPAVPERGLAVQGNLARATIDEWSTFAGVLAGNGAAGSDSGVLAALGALAGRIHALDVSVGRLEGLSLALDDARLRMGREPSGWSLGIRSRALNGFIVLPDGYTPRGEQPLVVQVDTLDLPGAPVDGNGKPLQLQPGDVPRMALALNALRLGGEDFGNWSLETVPLPTGVELRDVHGSWRALDINGNGNWVRNDDGSTTSRFTGIARADDIARVSVAFGVRPAVSSARSELTLQLAWPGRPVDADIATVAGTIGVDLRDGRFVTDSARTQALRALGVFNVNTWQRRLKLDFSDLYKKGVAFDTVTGQLAVQRGRVSTENLVVKGPSVQVAITGETELASDAVQGRLDVTLPVNSNLYVGCLAGLAACAGIVAFEQLWGNRLEKMTTLQYDVKGSWNDPVVTEISGNNGGSAPATESAPATDSAGATQHEER